MKTAFIHYHMKTGGVATVIKQQAQALKDVCDTLVMAGEIPETPFPFDTVQIPGLGYDKQGIEPDDPDDVANRIVKAIFSKWKHGCDVLHVHNATLAKSKNFLKILKTLQKNNIRIFVQIHDFAEDGRPLAYFPDEYLADCHYGAINSRDYNILLKAGLKKQGLHMIPNMINFFDPPREIPKPENLILYPIRAIRRKNIGEALLLSLFFRNNETLAITLPPESPNDVMSYNDWKAFVKNMNLSVMFEAGLARDFKKLVISSEFLITTSITEGFGFSFLEPWTAKKILWGRSIPDICHDFEKNGIQLSHLYKTLEVPVTWIDTKQFFEKWRASVSESGRHFKFQINEKRVKQSFEALTKDGLIDFGLLDEGFQKQVISQIISDKKSADMLAGLNPCLVDPGKVQDKAALIENNMNIVMSHYNKAMYRQNLMDIYKCVVRDSVCQRIDKNILLDRFFDLEKFSLLKWSQYNG
ncbi:MAG: glycosyltransferase family 4 protein [Desulfobacteraceae bacterium]|nr:glycosyltransferase family 4 protein [Desulfobacteraceae bacterium]